LPPQCNVLLMPSLDYSNKMNCTHKSLQEKIV